MDAFEQVHRLILQGLEDGAYPSAALAVGIGDKVYMKKTYGDCTDTTLFDMASLSKILGPTMIALRFLEEGRFRLYDTVADFFPETPADKKDITILQLMTHTGGFPAHFFLSDYTTDPADAAKVILSHPLAQAPGGDPIYSCMGYILLGKILEKISGLPLDELAESYVFGPLGMKNTGYHPTGPCAPTELDPATGKCLQGIVHDENARFLRGISANAGVFSNIDDMIIFVKMLALDGTATSPLLPWQPLLKTAPPIPGENSGALVSTWRAVPRVSWVTWSVPGPTATPASPVPALPSIRKPDCGWFY